LVATHGRAAADYLRYELSRRDQDGLISSALGDYLSPGTPGPAREDRRRAGTLFVARARRALAHASELARVAAPAGDAGARAPRAVPERPGGRRARWWWRGR